MADKFSPGKIDHQRRNAKWKAPASVVCGCLAALPLIGCAGNVGTSAQATALTPAAITEPAPNYGPAARIYSVGPARRCGISQS
jgi:hypothetical protein